ncbi:MAG: hypothetical protein OEV40_08290 [Acidimicrobiia bacterium]|nr:hypothetical protein [Acidimicrobiia bacterium]
MSRRLLVPAVLRGSVIRCLQRLPVAQGSVTRVRCRQLPLPPVPGPSVLAIRVRCLRHPVPSGSVIRCLPVPAVLAGWPIAPIPYLRGPGPASPPILVRCRPLPVPPLSVVAAIRSRLHRVRAAVPVTRSHACRLAPARRSPLRRVGRRCRQVSAMSRPPLRLLVCLPGRWPT